MVQPSLVLLPQRRITPSACLEFVQPVGSCRSKCSNESGEGTYAHVIAGILWAADKKAQIINLSLGSYGFSRFLADAVEYAHHSGAVIVAAGGNEATKAPLYPGALPNVISVSATDATIISGLDRIMAMPSTLLLPAYAFSVSIRITIISLPLVRRSLLRKCPVWQLSCGQNIRRSRIRTSRRYCFKPQMTWARKEKISSTGLVDINAARALRAELR